MTPAGYMAKHVAAHPDCLKSNRVKDIYSISKCISKDFADYTKCWKHNGYWFLNSPEAIREIAKSFETQVRQPDAKILEGYDVVTFSWNSTPECSPLSCNGLALEIETNEHCLLSSFEKTKQLLEEGKFEKSEPGSYRIFAVYSVQWPSA